MRPSFRHRRIRPLIRSGSTAVTPAIRVARSRPPAAPTRRPRRFCSARRAATPARHLVAIEINSWTPELEKSVEERRAQFDVLDAERQRPQNAQGRPTRSDSPSASTSERAIRTISQCRYRSVDSPNGIIRGGSFPTLTWCLSTDGHVDAQVLIDVSEFMVLLRQSLNVHG
jgi:hypothetical protein